MHAAVTGARDQPRSIGDEKGDSQGVLLSARRRKEEKQAGIHYRENWAGLKKGQELVQGAPKPKLATISSFCCLISEVEWSS